MLVQIRITIVRIKCSGIESYSLQLLGQDISLDNLLHWTLLSMVLHDLCSCSTVLFNKRPSSIMQHITG